MTLAEAAWQHYADQHRARQPRCAVSEVPIVECACPAHHRPLPTVVSLAALEKLAGHPLPAYRARPRDPRWKVSAPEPTVCEHRRDDLCPDCDQLLDQLLTDVPGLVAELGTAMRKGARFAEHGWRAGDVEHPDEAVLPWNPAAASALTDLRHIMTVWGNDSRVVHASGEACAGPSDRRTLLQQLSKTAAYAHRVIDRPRDRTYTVCPRCRTDIPVPAGNPDERTVLCHSEGCHYTATWTQHLSDLLDLNGDAMLTADELRFVLTHNGEPITRFRIRYLVAKHGLPREEISIPTWKDKRLVTEAHYAYRLRDVRELQARLDQPRTA